jgi:predicted Zn-dependent protease with MMP-like domain
VIHVPPERFEELVGEALDAIPDELARRMENVVVVVRDHAPWDGLLGLYEGVPLTNRSHYGEGMVMPDRITIFRGSICAMCRTEDEVRQQVTVTVIHEVGHHFGIDDDRLHELGWG